MFSAAESDALHARARAFIAASIHGEATEPFDDIALAIARFQAAHVPAIARLCRARAVDLEKAREAAEIPAVPTDVFRLARVAVHPRDCDVALFRTSGTTQGTRGEHPLRTTETYDLAAMAWGERFLFPDGRDLGVIVLAPPIAEQADSSLGFMLDRFAHALAGPASFHVHIKDGEGRLDLDGIERTVARLRGSDRRTLVLATSFALVHLLEQGEGLDLRLPAGSRVMQTGGFKGKSREVPAAFLRSMVAQAFAVPEAHVVSEYGMTELGSQLYEGTLARALGFHRGPARHGLLHAPAWLRVSAVDPASLAPVPRGEIGVARFVDLANVDSAVAVQTADRVRVLDEGVELLGRLPGAAPRGCSIAIDEMLGRS